jgi:hypothetical protein
MLAMPCTSGDTCGVVVLRSIGGATASSGRVSALRSEQGGLSLYETSWVLPGAGTSNLFTGFAKRRGLSGALK